jgi:hypothetical protein
MSQLSFRTFKNGVWNGSYARGGKDHALNLHLEFHSDGRTNKITGAGTCDELGYITVHGEYTDSTPYSVTIQLNSVKYSTVMELSGFREKQTNGMFGTWLVKTQGNKALENFNGSGSFHLKPAESQLNGDNMYTSYQTEKRIRQLIEMGFERKIVEQAVNKFSTYEQALDWLFKQNEALYSENLTEENSSKNLTQNQGEKVSENEQTIMNMGFTLEQAKHALEIANGDVEQATNLLLDE